MARRSNTDEIESTEAESMPESSESTEPSESAEATDPVFEANKPEDKPEEPNGNGDEVDLTEFSAAAEASVAQRDEATGVIPDAAIEPVVIVYRNLPGGIKTKNKAKGLVAEGVKDGMAKLSIQLARAWMQLQDALTTPKAAAGERVPANPTEAAVTLDAALQLARRLVAENIGEGVAEDWQEQADKLYNDNTASADSYLEWFRESNGDEPKVSDAVKMAVKLYKGRAAKLAKRTGSARAPFEGTRRNIGEHIKQAFADVESGTFLTVAQIRSKQSTEYGDDLPSPGAISARLFPPSGKCTVEGITPGQNDRGNKGATKD